MPVYEKLDFWSLKAQKEGYPARSVYKLIEIQEKFKVFKSGSRVLDFGAAPGSWSMYVIKTMKGNGFVAGVDLQEITIKPHFNNYEFIQGDLFDLAIQERLTNHGPFDLVMSDAAPSTTGNRFIDQSRSLALVEEVIGYAEKFLTHGGNFIAKIFQGGDERKLIDLLKPQYTVVKTFKPSCCRRESFETFLIATGKKG